MGRVGLLRALLAACGIVLAAPAAAQDHRLPPDTGEIVAPPPPPQRLEAWGGAEANRQSWSVYSGLNWAPFGAIQRPGWRLRFAGGLGAYRYDNTIEGRWTKVRARSTFADILAGYQFQTGGLTLKLFAGGTFEGQSLSPFDSSNEMAGQVAGLKVAAEGWLDVSPTVFAALNVSWASINDSAAGRLRLGYRLSPSLSVGLEAGAARNSEGQSGRGGAFVRYQWQTSEFSASVGWSGLIEGQGHSPYATAVYLVRF